MAPSMPWAHTPQAHSHARANIMNELIKTERILLSAAKVASALFSPYYIAFVSFIILLCFSYLRIMPLTYKLIVLGVVYCFTIFIPTLTSFLFRKINGFSADDMMQRNPRFATFLVHLVSYATCLAIMRGLNIPWYMLGIILTALLIILLCIIVNVRWRLSEHMAGVGGLVGGLVAFSMLFGYNPVWWLSAIILVAGIVGTARMIQGHHTLGEVLWAFAAGMACAFMVLHPLYNHPLRFLLF